MDVSNEVECAGVECVRATYVVAHTAIPNFQLRHHALSGTFYRTTGHVFWQEDRFPHIHRMRSDIHFSGKVLALKLVLPDSCVQSDFPVEAILE